METESFDLRECRCPMALLLTKRACAKLDQGEQLTLMVTDGASLRDIHRYLHRNGFLIEKHIVAEATVLYITKN